MQVDDHLHAGQQFGTLAFSAPEGILRVGHEPKRSIKSEMWSIGIIIFALLSGAFPFMGDNQLKIRKRILQCDYNFEPAEVWESISDDAKDLIEKLLWHSVETRLSPAEAL